MSWGSASRGNPLTNSLWALLLTGLLRFYAGSSAEERREAPKRAIEGRRFEPFPACRGSVAQLVEHRLNEPDGRRFEPDQTHHGQVAQVQSIQCKLGGWRFKSSPVHQASALGRGLRSNAPQLAGSTPARCAKPLQAPGRPSDVPSERSRRARSHAARGNASVSATYRRHVRTGSSPLSLQPARTSSRKPCIPRSTSALRPPP
jgi:hypothetical protein